MFTYVVFVVCSTLTRAVVCNHKNKTYREVCINIILKYPFSNTIVQLYNQGADTGFQRGWGQICKYKKTNKTYRVVPT